jgi:mRNA-degrading endonuclease RelE of RelBE toxin-antitoxin system
MGNYQFQFSKQAQKDIAQLTAKQKTKLQEILMEVLSENPYVGKALK